MRVDLAHNKPIDIIAIERLRTFEPDEGYWLAYSGGKDSTVIWDLAKRSGVTFEAHYSYVPIDPPELRAFIREQDGIIIDKPKESFVSVARRRGCMPLRRRRWCCEIFKESGGQGRLIITGVRWAESRRRSTRQMVEHCTRKKHTNYLHPIIDWDDADVWDYIHECGLPYCSLYDEGWKRLGCVLCPMVRDVPRQMERWPQIVRVWRMIARAIWEEHPDEERFGDFEGFWSWWLDRDAVWQKPDEGQGTFCFEDSAPLAVAELADAPQRNGVGESLSPLRVRIPSASTKKPQRLSGWLVLTKKDSAPPELPRFLP